MFAFFGRSAARAAENDALTIDADGVAHFSGKRNHFKDEEKEGDLRVGAAWGVPGIYSQTEHVVVGSYKGITWLPGNVVIAKQDTANKLDAIGTVAPQNVPLCNVDVSGTVKAKSLETSSGISLAAVQNAVTAAQNAVNILIPVGTIMAYGGDTRNGKVVNDLKDQGWLPCDGGAYSAHDYPKLAEVIGNAFGTSEYRICAAGFCAAPTKAPNDIPTPRPAGRKKGGSAGDKVGSVQDDEFKSHAHQYQASKYVDTGGNFSGSHWTPGDAQTGLAGGNETRPKNVNVNWIIRAK